MSLLGESGSDGSEFRRPQSKVHITNVEWFIEVTRYLDVPKENRKWMRADGAREAERLVIRATVTL